MFGIFQFKQQVQTSDVTTQLNVIEANAIRTQRQDSIVQLILIGNLVEYA